MNIIKLFKGLFRRKKNPKNIFLSKGTHSTYHKGMSLLEAVAYHAGEPHSTYPQCASPVIAAFGRTWNDALDHDQRQRLAVYIPRMVGSKGTDDQELVRSWMAFDWLVRTHTPAWLRLAGLTDHANRLAGLDPIVDQATLEAAQPVIDDAQTAARAARDVARDVAWAATCAAAGDAARAAAWNAAGDAAWNATWNAAGVAARITAMNAAWNATWNAAGVAAGVAAMDAAGDALAATRDELIESAHDLLDRMLAVTEI